MKIETCVTISEELLKEFDEFTNGACNRSELVETALRKHLADLKRQRRISDNAAKEIELLNRIAIEEREEREEQIRLVAEVNLAALDK